MKFQSDNFTSQKDSAVKKLNLKGEEMLNMLEMFNKEETHQEDKFKFLKSKLQKDQDICKEILQKQT